MNIDVQQVVSSIALFNIPGWTNVTADQVTVVSIGDGYVNTTCKVEKVSRESDEASEGPRKLLLKKYGGNIMDAKIKDTININSSLVQSLIAHELSCRNWGSKVYGLLEDGRIEEFIEGDTLKHVEAFDPELLVDTAKSYARFHSLKLPLKQKPKDMVQDCLNSLENARNDLQTAIESGVMDQLALQTYTNLLKFPVIEEAKWINQVRSKIKQRTVLCTMDPQYLNRMVRRERPEGVNASRVVLIDFDLTAYSDRGYDLGGHFVNRLFNFGGKGEKVSHVPYPSESERLAFLTTYLEECEKLFDDFDKDSLDSLQQLVLEADFNALVYTLTISIICYGTYAILKSQPKIYTFISPMVALFGRLKQEFIAKYPNLF